MQTLILKSAVLSLSLSEFASSGNKGGHSFSLQPRLKHPSSTGQELHAKHVSWRRRWWLKLWPQMSACWICSESGWMELRSFFPPQDTLEGLGGSSQTEWVVQDRRETATQMSPNDLSHVLSCAVWSTSSTTSQRQTQCFFYPVRFVWQLWAVLTFLITGIPSLSSESHVSPDVVLLNVCGKLRMTCSFVRQVLLHLFGNWAQFQHDKLNTFT